jgi:hypothetical protein
MPDYRKSAGRKIQHFAEGGKVEDYGSEEFPGGLMDVMRRKRAGADDDEKIAKKRFDDDGSRIPGARKAQNDTWYKNSKFNRKGGYFEEK